jgi:uncharacterized membrane-anchored protein
MKATLDEVRGMTGIIDYFVLQGDPYPGIPVMLACILAFGIIIVTCLLYAYRARKNRAARKEDFRTYMSMAVFGACVLVWVIWTIWSHMISEGPPA